MERTLTGFALTVGRVVGQGELQLLHEAGCQHLEAVTSVTHAVFGGPHLILLALEVCGVWHHVHGPWRAQVHEAVLELQEAICSRRAVLKLASRIEPSASEGVDLF
ncbi:hypothetical protein GUJ93_ZPchr0013g36914 [Zizania palustris]|uniref:Uncharacterized protein n=1 Tax=Zizania palustris TaxID=103762 RepID=A0A8J5X2I6_ZIZPA|nr:hypothetical protein GUJ93_ZPchr0013g36914 [Zizania palustris]